MIHMAKRPVATALAKIVAYAENAQLRRGMLYCQAAMCENQVIVVFVVIGVVVVVVVVAAVYTGRYASVANIDPP